MYSFNNETTGIEDQEYFGTNDGIPIRNPKSSGMLQGGKNILEYPCQNVSRSVPYFKKHDNSKNGKNMNEEIYDLLD